MYSGMAVASLLAILVSRSLLQQANLSCSLTEGRAPITGRAQGDMFQGEGKTTGPKEGTYRGS